MAQHLASLSIINVELELLTLSNTYEIEWSNGNSSLNKTQGVAVTEKDSSANAKTVREKV